jgi:glycosyl transferase, family 25
MLFDRAFYINLDSRCDRRIQIEAELERMEIPYERFSALTGGAVGCSKSHIAVLKLARHLKLNAVAIFEDDFQFTVSRDEFRHLLKIPNSYDVIMLGYYSLNSEFYTDNLARVKSAQTSHGYIIHSKFYDEFIEHLEIATEQLEKTGEHWNYAIDQAWKKLQPVREWYAIIPMVGIQRPSFSDCANQFVNYN